MDIIDNIMYATMRSVLSNGELISSPYFQLEFDDFAPTSPDAPALQVYNFPIEQKIAYASLFDHCVIEQSIQKHFWDINGNVFDDEGILASDGNNFQYRWEMSDGTSTVTNTVSNFSLSTTYHLFYAFILENTRIAQIFEKVIEKYVYDEELGVAPPDVRQWLLNTESLFYKDGGCRVDSIRSYIRPDAQKNRKNAYYRMFGAEVAVSETGSAGAFNKPKAVNQEFILVFERYLSEVYNAYRHSRSSCCHSADLNNLRELAIEIRESFACRRGGSPGGEINAFVRTNLAVEEYSSVVMMSWLALMVSDNTPIVNFLGCQSSSIGDRLQRLGQKVGINAHAQSQALFEMAGAASNVLSIIETGTYLESIGHIQAMITSLNEPGDPTPDSELMESFLVLINNWEKATGHKLKAETQQHAPKEVTVVEKVVAKSAAVRAFLN